MMAECIACKRSMLPQHLVDGDWCVDCWEGDD